MHVTVDPSSLGDDGAITGEAARLLETIAVQADLEPLAIAFPGGLTAATLAEMGARWSDNLVAARLGLRGLAGATRVAAGTYAVVEQVVRRALADRGGLR